MSLRSDKKLAFLTTSPSLASHTATASSFHGVTTLRPCTTPTIFRAHHSNRARIFMLGAAPKPPQPSNDDDNDDETDDDNKSKSEEDTTSSNDEKTSSSSEKTSEEVTADDILNSPAFLKKKLELVQKELLELKSNVEKSDDEINEEKQRYVRLAADFENYRRRSVEDLRQQESKSTARVCKEILNVLDNFERATKAVNAQTENEKSIVKSYQSINKQLLDALVKLKVEPIDSVGQSFDPEIHEAIQRLESNDYPEDVVCQQYSRGYKIGDTLIRAAVVGVSAGPGPADGEGGSDDSAHGEDEEKNGNGAKETEEVGKAKEVQQAADGL